MLRNLLDQIVGRRLWPIPALAVLVAIVAPLLFLKSAPDDAPSADSAAPAAATEAKLPPRAARLLAANDAGSAGGRATGESQDPFNPPASHRAAAAAAAGGAAGGSTNSSGGSSGGSASKPIPVVIKNADGSSTKSGKSSTTTTTDDGDDSSSSSTSGGSSPRTYSVDVRFGKKVDTKIRRAIPRMQGFYIHGKLVAVFVKYSPSRERAVFAVAPGLHISGPVKCRVKDGACRYLDIPAGAHAWLTLVKPNRTVVKRRLDVVRAKARTAGTATKAASAGTRAEQACLLGKLVAMKAGDALVDRDACER